MKILFVATGESVHTARWISQILDQGWRLHLFPSVDLGFIHPDIKNLTVHHSIFNPANNKNVKCMGIPIYNSTLASWLVILLKKLFPNYRTIQLWFLIKILRPNVIHSFGVQEAGYLTLSVQKIFGINFPKWLVSIRGSDLFYYGRLKEHKENTRKVIRQCNYVFCPSQRDFDLALKFGFKGKSLPFFPNTGGIKSNSKFRRPSLRKDIFIKGYQGVAGRGLVIVRALEKCADALKGYKIVAYLTKKDVDVALELFSQKTGIPIKIMPRGTNWKKILQQMSRSRLHIGASISDGIPNSMLEAMAMGSFPIQSWTAVTEGWIKDGINGLLIPPEDPEIIEKSIRRTLKDDKLVDRAAVINRQIIKEKLNWEEIKNKTIKLYEDIVRSNNVSG